jgi:hypothetical protein
MAFHNPGKYFKTNKTYAKNLSTSYFSVFSVPLWFVKYRIYGYGKKKQRHYLLTPHYYH